MNKQILAIFLLAMASPAASADDVIRHEVRTDKYPVSTAAPQLSIDNIWGSVRVRPGPQGEISITVDETRSAPDQAMFDRSLELLKLDTYADRNGVSITVGRRDLYRNSPNHCNGCRVEAHFDILVPPGTQLDVSTVMDGKIDVAGVYGSVSASNVNGPIGISDMQACGDIESVNGGIELNFLSAPGGDCAIETINGDVVVQMPAGSGLDIALDIFNGKVVSAFETDTFAVPAAIEYERSDNGHHYRIQQLAGLRLAGGGPVFTISSMNGDVRFQQN